MITREQIIESLSFLNDESQKIIVVYGLKDDMTILKLDIHRDHLAVLLDMMKASIQESMVEKVYKVNQNKTFVIYKIQYRDKKSTFYEWKKEWQRN